MFAKFRGNFGPGNQDLKKKVFCQMCIYQQTCQNAGCGNFYTFPTLKFDIQGVR